MRNAEDKAMQSDLLPSDKQSIQTNKFDWAGLEKIEKTT